MHNLILIHVYIKRFSVFWAVFCTFGFKVWSTNMTQKKFLKTKTKKVLKNAEIQTISNSLKKFLKNVPKKVISKDVTKMCTFFTFTCVRQTCFPYNFFWCSTFFKTFSTDLKSAWNSAFLYLSWLNNFFCHISTFFKLWSQTSKKWQQK